MMEVQNQKGECSNEIEFYFRPDQHLLMDLSCGGSGTIIQKGTHDELVSDKTGKYYELWNAQAQYYHN